MGCGHNSGRVHATDRRRRRRRRRYRHDAIIMFISFHCSSSAGLRDCATVLTCAHDHDDECDEKKTGRDD